MNEKTNEILGECDLDLSAYGDNEFKTMNLETGTGGSLEVAVKGTPHQSKGKEPE